MTEEGLRTDAVLRLQTAGIKILSMEELSETEGNPRLEVFVAIMKPKGAGGYVCRISVELQQTVFLARDPSVILHVGTWRSETLGVSLTAEEIRGKVKDLVDRFVVAYLSMNPQDEDLTRERPIPIGESSDF
jgi:hypothetical protein